MVQVVLLASEVWCQAAFAFHLVSVLVDCLKSFCDGHLRHAIGFISIFP